jgi:uncharacterized protein (DUF1778 family)
VKKDCGSPAAGAGNNQNRKPTVISLRVDNGTLSLLKDAHSALGVSRTKFILECVRRYAPQVAKDVAEEKLENAKRFESEQKRLTRDSQN